MIAACVVVFSYGAFAIASQALLYSAYATALGGRDIAIGLFWSAWLLWSGCGLLLYRFRRSALDLGKGMEALLLACLAVFGLHYVLLALLSAGAHISFSSLASVVRWLVLASSPTGLFTGFLFPAVCRWGRDACGVSARRMAGAGVCGAAIGGAGTSILFSADVGPLFIVLPTAALICASAAVLSFARPAGKARYIALACLFAIAAGGVLRADLMMGRFTQGMQWRRLAPGGTFEGSFVTGLGEYLYGADGDRWIVTHQGHMCDAVGDDAAAGRVAAMALCQNNAAERVLVIGDSLAVCQSFLKSPQIKTVDWLHPDPGYIRSIIARLPDAFVTNDSRLHYVTGDVGDVLTQNRGAYDIVMVNPAGPVNAISGRYTSAEFFEAVRQSLGGLGVFLLGVRHEGDYSRKPDFVGASMYLTLHTVFVQTIVVPAKGQTFFVSGASSHLEMSPVVLEIRLSQLENAAAVLPPSLLSSVYRPDRAVEALNSFDAVDFPEERLVGGAGGLDFLLFDVLEAASRLGVSLAGPAEIVQRGGPAVVIAPVILLVLIRVTYVVRTMPRVGRMPGHLSASAVSPDAVFSAACAGAVGMGLFIALLYAYQARFGSLYADTGWMVSLLVAAVAAGVGVIAWLGWQLKRCGPERRYLSACVMIAAAGACTAGLAGAGTWIGSIQTKTAFAACLSVVGVSSGALLALGAATLRLRRDSVGSQAIGIAGLTSSAGTVVCVLLLPIVGLAAMLYALGVCTLGIAVFVLAGRRRAARPGPARVAHAVFTPVGYCLFAAALCVVVDFHITVWRERSRARLQSTAVVAEWIRNGRVSEKAAVLANPSREAKYLEVREGMRVRGYILRSEEFTGTVYGYGGPMALVMYADSNGTLVDYRLTRSRETPRYIRRISEWMESLKGRPLLISRPLEGVDAVSGATLSCNAILRLLRDSGRQFAVSVFAQHAPSERTRWTGMVDWPLTFWLAGGLLALGAIWHGKIWSRLVVLAYTVGVCGFWLNRQYSTDHIMRLANGSGVLAGPVGILLLIVGVPVLVLLVGNVYCGYLCPFGALQELIGYLVPRRFKVKLSARAISTGRFVKYLVLFAALATFLISGGKRVLEGDPLTTFFSRQFWSADSVSSLVLAASIYVAAMFVARPWCRYLCPTGAFLSLFNSAGWLGRFLPVKKFGRCDFGLSGKDHLDCIHCDRCRYDSVLIPRREDVVAKTRRPLASMLFMAAAASLAILITTSMLRSKDAAPGSSPLVKNEQTGASNEPVGPRDPGRRGRGR